MIRMGKKRKWHPGQGIWIWGNWYWGLIGSYLFQCNFFVVDISSTESQKNDTEKKKKYIYIVIHQIELSLEPSNTTEFLCWSACEVSGNWESDPTRHDTSILIRSVIFFTHKEQRESSPGIYKIDSKWGNLLKSYAVQELRVNVLSDDK